ncbi:hypothetical protein DFJ73DRAFT_812966 [Zopfochytrium polystomum]|nr:hypothetical protein DFJ73DRAFT_812966 [Zopfochytrium polystomum]
MCKPLQLQDYYAKRVFVLECILRGIVRTPLPFGARCIAVVRVEPNASAYLATLISRHKTLKPAKAKQTLEPSAQLDFDSQGRLISTYPLDECSVRGLKDISGSFGKQIPARDSAPKPYYQMTISSKFDINPTWNEHFTFVLDAEEYGQDSALIVEFYRDPPVSQPSKSDGTPTVSQSIRPINDLFGYTSLPLRNFTGADAGRIRSVEDAHVRLFPPYSNLPGADHVQCAVEIRVPDNWRGQMNAGGKKKPTQPPTIPTKSSTVFGSVPDFANDPDDKRESTERRSRPSTPLKVADSQSKNALMERLMREIDQRGAAIRKLGQDLVNCRERNLALETQIRQLESEKKAMEAQHQNMMHAVDLDVISRAELEKRYIILSGKLQHEIARGKKMAGTLHQLQFATIAKNKVEKEYLELRQAHTAQQETLQRLQAKVQQVSNLKEAMIEQESLVKKLKAKLAVNARLHENDAQPSPLASPSTALADNALREENKKLQAQVAELEAKLQRQTTSALAIGSRCTEEDYVNALLRAETSEVRVAALEAELLQSAKNFASKLSGLTERLRVYEAGAAVGSAATIPPSKAPNTAPRQGVGTPAPLSSVRLRPITTGTDP